MEVPSKEYTITGMKEAYSPYTAGRLARREYARPGSGGRRVYSCMCDQMTGNFPLLTYNDVIIHSLVPRLLPHAETFSGYEANHTGYLTLLLLYHSFQYFYLI